MYQNTEYEEEFSLRDIWFHLLYHWRSIILCALICALVLGGYSFLKNRNTYPNTNAQETSDGTDAGNSVYEGNAEIFQNLLDGALYYQQNSLLLQLNPYYIWKSSAVYTVVIDYEASEKSVPFFITAIIADSYRTAIYAKPEIDTLQSIYGNADPQYLLEMFSLTTDTETGTETENTVNISGSELSPTFIISAYGKDKKQAEAGLAYYKRIIEEYSQTNPQKISKHYLISLNEYTIQTADSKLEEKQA